MKVKSLFLVLALLLSAGLFSFVLDKPETETFTDERDGKQYSIVKIGKQWWFAENFNYEAEGSWCKDCEQVGRMYNYDAAVKACPKGWHLPTVAEWKELMRHLGGEEVAAGKMKKVGKWGVETAKCNNSSGFSAIAAPERGTRGDIRESDKATFWSLDKTDDGSPGAWTFVVSPNNAQLMQMGYYRSSGFSVRYVKD